MTPRLLRSQRGFTYIAVMVMVIIMGITLGAAGTFWGTRMKRERETELLWRGLQYRDAIRQWYGYVWDPKTKAFKQSRNVPLTDLKHLVKDPNNPGSKRYLRKLYPDPITGKEEWGVVRGANQEIIGVASKSEQKPLKQAVFPDDTESGLEPQDFEAKEKYSDWQFIYNRFPQPATEGGASGAGIQSGPGSKAPRSSWKGFTIPR